jgi:uncharacterized protein YjbI with pentapeptide repeats
LTDLKNTLRQLHNNLNTLRERESKYAGDAPIALLNQITDHEQAIALTEQALNSDLTEAEWKEALEPLLVSLGRELDVSVQHSKTSYDEQYEMTLNWDGKTRLRGFELAERDLSSLNLKAVDLGGANLKQADLSGSNLAGANLHRANLCGAILINTNLAQANLTGADLRQAKLGGTRLDEANLSGADLHGVILERERWLKWHVITLPSRRLGVATKRTLTSFGSSQSKSIDFSQANLAGIDLSYFDLQRANLGQANLQGANLEGADLTEVNLAGANLTDVNLCDADLVKVNLQHANLTQADLSWAELSQAQYNQHTQWPTGFDPTRTGAELVE